MNHLRTAISSLLLLTVGTMVGLIVAFVFVDTETIPPALVRGAVEPSSVPIFGDDVWRAADEDGEAGDEWEPAPTPVDRAPAPTPSESTGFTPTEPAATDLRGLFDPPVEEDREEVADEAIAEPTPPEEWARTDVTPPAAEPDASWFEHPVPVAAPVSLQAIVVHESPTDVLTPTNPITTADLKTPVPEPTLPNSPTPGPVLRVAGVALPPVPEPDPIGSVSQTIPRVADDGAAPPKPSPANPELRVVPQKGAPGVLPEALEPVPFEPVPFDPNPYQPFDPPCRDCPPEFVEPVFHELVADPDRGWCTACSPWKKLFSARLCDESCDRGIGRRRLDFAPFRMDVSQPSNVWAFRYRSHYGLENPDASEYFWAKQGTSPAIPERNVDHQALWIVHEIGGGRFSMLTEFPIRFLDPELNDNTAGIGDVRLGPKIVLADGRDWQVTHIMKTWMPTGSPRKGLGTGHTGIEPGFLFRYKWTEDTYLHSEFKVRFPVGGNPNHAGTVITYGFAVSSVWHDTDSFALIPTLELTGLSFLDGSKTLPSGAIVDSDGTTFSVQPGVRLVLGPPGDLGQFEVGLGSGVTLAGDAPFQYATNLEVRWAY